MIDKLENHVILCGYGRVGQAVAQELRRQGVACVVIDGQEDRVDQASKEGFAALCGDASHDETLLAAGIGRARSLVSAVDSDAANLYIALSARVLAPGLHIVARASDPGAGQAATGGGQPGAVALYGRGPPPGAALCALGRD